MKKAEKSPRGYTYLKIFGVLILLLVLGTTIWRGIELFQTRSFLGDTYTTLYSNGETHYLVGYLSSGAFRVAELKEPPNLSLQKASRVQLSMALGVPIDAVVVDSELNNESDVFSLKSCIMMTLLPHSYVMRDLNGIDACNYFLKKRGIEVELETIDYSNENSELLDSFFRDEDVFNEAVSVAVVNGTEVAGLGGAFAEILDRRGYNVVSVTNSQSPVRTSYVDVQRGKDSASADLLLGLFQGARKESGESGAADVVVVLGGDVAR